VLAGLAIANAGICANYNIGIASFRPVDTMALLRRKLGTS
jgi:hypothetical protein